MDNTLKTELINSLKKINKLNQENIEYYANRCESSIDACGETEIVLDGNKTLASYGLIICDKNNFLNTKTITRNGDKYDVDRVKSLVAIVKDNKLILAESTSDVFSQEHDDWLFEENETFSSLSTEEITNKYF